MSSTRSIAAERTAFPAEFAYEERFWARLADQLTLPGRAPVTTWLVTLAALLVATPLSLAVYAAGTASAPSRTEPLPREWQWEKETVPTDQMYRQSVPGESGSVIEQTGRPA